MKFITLALALFFNLISIAQQFNQISQESPSSWTQFKNFVELNNNLIYQTSSGIFKSDGTYSGTNQITNFGDITDAKLGLNLFIVTSDYQNSQYSYKLYKTDGTNMGTLLVKDFGVKSFCSNFCEFNGSIYFVTVYVDQVFGNTIHELWKSDGTLSGTISIKDWTNSGYGNSIYIREFNNKIYFSGNESDGTFSGTIQTGVNLPHINSSSILNGFIYYSGTDGKLWKTNGTTSGTIQAVNFPSSGNFYTSNGWIYFAGGLSGAGSTGIELCRTDGTLANTTVIKDIYYGFNSSYPNDFIYHNGNVFFTANDGIHGKELWKTDGTNIGTTLVKDIFTGSNGIAEFYKTIHDSQFYFTANRAEYGVYSGGGVWKSDGTEINTSLVQSFDSVGVILEVNCNLFLSAVDSISSVSTSVLNAQLWCDTISNCISAELNETNLSQFKLYPNPTSDEINISIPSEYIHEEYYILDFTGRTVLMGEFTEVANKVDISGLKKGTYFIRITGENSVLKIVKE